MAFGLPIRWRRITRGSAASRDVFLIPKINHIIRHCKFVSQSACIFLKKKNQKNSKRQVLFKLEKKKPVEEKNYRWSEFFTSWTITGEKCTRAHVPENKSIYLSIYLSLWKPFWKRVYIYTWAASIFLWEQCLCLFQRWFTVFPNHIINTTQKLKLCFILKKGQYFKDNIFLAFINPSGRQVFPNEKEVTVLILTRRLCFPFVF